MYDTVTMGNVIIPNFRFTNLSTYLTCKFQIACILFLPKMQIKVGYAHCCKTSAFSPIVLSLKPFLLLSLSDNHLKRSQSSHLLCSTFLAHYAVLPQNITWELRKVPGGEGWDFFLELALSTGHQNVTSHVQVLIKF